MMHGTMNLKVNISVMLNPLNAKLNPICHLLALLGAHHILHVSRIRVKSAETRIFLEDIPLCYRT
jgi:hypothetical protein